MEHYWKLRFYEDGDEESIVDLINLTIPAARYSINRWLWEYKNNPYGFLAVVAQNDKRIVGHMGLFFFRLKVGERIILGSQACDLGIHPDFRGKGIFLAIGRALMKGAGEKGVCLTYGFPNRPAYFGHLKYGWFDVARIPVLINFFNTYTALGNRIYEKHRELKMIDPLIRESARFADYYFSRARDRKPWSIDNLETHEISCVDERIDEFWERVSKGNGIMVVRDQRYLKWRFFDRPDFRYHVIIAEKNDNIEGYIVFSAEESKNGKVGHIDDALASSKEVAQNLILSAIDFFQRKEVDLVECWMLKGFVWYNVMREKGFVPMHFFVPTEKKRFIVRINSEDFFHYYKCVQRKWYITYADSDYAGGNPSII